MVGAEKAEAAEAAEADPPDRSRQAGPDQSARALTSSPSLCLSDAPLLGREVGRLRADDEPARGCSRLAACCLALALCGFLLALAPACLGGSNPTAARCSTIPRDPSPKEGLARRGARSFTRASGLLTFS